MALNGVSIVGPQDEVKKTGSKKGGGKMGAMIGGTVGGVAGAMAGSGTGAGMVGGAIGGAAGGAALGERVGNMIQPAREGSSAITRRVQSTGPQVVHSPQSEQLKSSILALQQQPPAIQQQYQAPLVTAYMKSLAQDNPGGGVA